MSQRINNYKNIDTHTAPDIVSWPMGNASYFWFHEDEMKCKSSRNNRQRNRSAADTQRHIAYKITVKVYFILDTQSTDYT